MNANDAPAASFSLEDGCLCLRGDWTLSNHAGLRRAIDRAKGEAIHAVRLELSEVGALDTAGAALLLRLVGAERLLALLAEGHDIAPERKALLEAVGRAMHGREAVPPTPAGSAIADFLAHVGEGVMAFYRHVVDLLGFVGITLTAMLRVGINPLRWRMTSLVAHLEQTALDAVPIVALLTFLVGAVIAFLGATVLDDFGASIYTVNLVAYSFLREFGVMLAAILVAGRTASAFTAQIGSMRANEEVDAIRTLGLDPIELLVLPRVTALLIALPLLTFVAILSGIVGGMVVCIVSLKIPVSMFLSILGNDIGVSHFLVGMVKAPVFAFMIALIGCMEGFKVSGSAQSVGEHTTSSVVQSIFIVILFDAIAAMICMEMGW